MRGQPGDACPQVLDFLAGVGQIGPAPLGLQQFHHVVVQRDGVAGPAPQGLERLVPGGPPRPKCQVLLVGDLGRPVHGQHGHVLEHVVGQVGVAGNGETYPSSRARSRSKRPDDGVRVHWVGPYSLMSVGEGILTGKADPKTDLQSGPGPIEGEHSV